MVTPNLAWPSAGDFALAVLAIERTARHEAVRGARPRLGALGLPLSASGQHAIVFPLDTREGTLALRCATTPGGQEAERYLALEQHRARHPVASFATCRLIDDAILVGPHAWPAVTLEWIAGEPLDMAIAARLDDTDALRRLAEEWRRVAAEVARADVAHGDYQHGNVLVDEAGSIRLVDFDGVWLPTLAHLPPRESGHPAYQHPARARDGSWGPKIDAFSVLLIDVSLRAVAAERELWTDFHHGDNVLFSQNDLESPGEGGLWTRLSESPDRDVAALGARLASWCRDPIDAHSVEEALSPPPSRPLSPMPAIESARTLDRPLQVVLAPDDGARPSSGRPGSPSVSRPRRFVTVAASIMLLLAPGLTWVALQDREAGSNGTEQASHTVTETDQPATTAPASAPPTMAPTTVLVPPSTTQSPNGSAQGEKPVPPTTIAPPPPPAPSSVVVPQLIGKTHAQAKAMLEALGLVAEPWPFNRTDVPRYTVVDQPTKFAAGTRVPPGTKIQFGVADPPYCAAHPTKETCAR
jgi:hypothetical protein